MLDWLVGINKRKTYRAESEPTGPLDMKILLAEAEFLEATIINISIGGVAAYLAASECPGLAARQIVTIRLQLTETKRAVNLQGLVLSVSKKEDDKLFCRFKFTEPAEVSQQLDESFWQYLNRRQAFRVSPASAEVVAVTFESVDGAGQGRLIDISTSGLGLEVASEVAENLSQTEPMTLTFQLTGMPLRLRGTICYSKLSGGSRKLGINFDKEKTPNYPKQEEAIAGYIMERQKQILQQQAMLRR